MPVRLHMVLGVAIFLVGFAITGAALAARTYPDQVGDARLSPDIRAVVISNTATNVTFRFTFTSAPPLRVSRSGAWIEMLLVGIDVPPLVAPPAVPGGPWRPDFNLGTHGSSTSGVIVRARTGYEGVGWKRVGTFRIVTTGSTLRFSIPRRMLGDPAWFTFSVAAARERTDETLEPARATPDFVPARGTLRYTLGD